MMPAETVRNPQASPDARARLVVMLTAIDAERVGPSVERLAKALGQPRLVVAAPQDPGVNLEAAPAPGVELVRYPRSPGTGAEWVLSAGDYQAAQQLLVEHEAGAVLLLGAEWETLQPEALRRLAEGTLRTGSDLVLPRYRLPESSALVNSAILYPLSRALFATAARFPLAIDLCLSARMAGVMATAAQRLMATSQPEGLLWPVVEAASAGLSVGQVEAGERALPPPALPDLNSLLALVCGSLFSVVEAKAAVWQRARRASPQSLLGTAAAPAAASSDEIRAMVEAFRLAQANLLEIWSLVLPPQSLLALRRLAAQTEEKFTVPDPLWARIVYDFLLAYRLRTLNRSHLLGALTPLYLAWVASHLQKLAAGVEAEEHIEATALAFEVEKPYLVARWRWPDRFNP